MDPKMKKTLKIGGIALLSTAAASATSFATTKFLMQTALDRQLPKAAEKAGERIAGNSVDEGFLRAVVDASERLEAKLLETVSITAADGTPLVGHWSCNPRAKRVILAMHGWRSSWSRDFGTVSDFWDAHQCSVLYAEQRGQNNSGGDYMGFGLSERYDCLDWINWIMERCGTDIPIYLAGVSMGATTVLMAAGLPLPDSVHGIFADCGFTSPDAIWRHIANNNLHIAYGLRGMIIDELYQKKTNLDANYSTVDALKDSDIPILFVHGTDDHFVPVSMTYENYKACRAPKRLLIVPGADHGMSYYLEPEQYEAMALQFWRDFDLWGRKKPVNPEMNTDRSENHENPDRNQ